MLHFPSTTTAKRSARPISVSPVSYETSFLVPKQANIAKTEDSFFTFSSKPITEDAIPKENKKEDVPVHEEPVVEPPIQQPVKEETVEIKEIAKDINTLAIDPISLKFIPEDQWSSHQNVNFCTLQSSYFSKRSSKKLRFEHKLWNALILTKNYPYLYSVIGVIWETNTIIKVDVNVFAKLLGISKATSALCSPQGSFPSHGFSELLDEKHKRISLSETENIRFYEHESGKFRADSTISDLEQCKWTSKNKNVSHFWDFSGCFE